MSITRLKEDKQPRILEETDRTIALSDAIFAVAITLLVLDISVPELGQLSGNALNIQLLGQLNDSTRNIISYIISFLAIGVYWRVHHLIFRYIKHGDAILSYLNLVLLMVIVFLPVPTGYIGKYGDSPVAVIFYVLIVALTGLILCIIWLYATNKHRLVDQDLHPDLIKYYAINFLISPAIFLLSIPIVYVNIFAPAISGPDLAKYFWILSLPAHSIYRKLYRERALSHSHTVDKTTLLDQD
jgi:uncharacterized membrane protein